MEELLVGEYQVVYELLDQVPVSSLLHHLLVLQVQNYFSRKVFEVMDLLFWVIASDVPHSLFVIFLNVMVGPEVFDDLRLWEVNNLELLLVIQHFNSTHEVLRLFSGSLDPFVQLVF